MHTSTLTALGIATALALNAGAAASVTITAPGGDIPDDTPAGLALATSVQDDFAVSGVIVSLIWPETATPGNTTRDGHTWVGDLTATLTSDDGAGDVRSATLFRRLGKTSPVSGHGFSADLAGVYTFADGGSDLWAAGGSATALSVAIPPNSYQPIDNLFNFATASGAPVSLTETFAGASSKGTWTLTLADMAGGEVGRLDGWSLTLIPAPGATALIWVGSLGLLGRRRRA